MRELSVSELNQISGADIGYDELVSMWNAVGNFPSKYLSYDDAAKAINEIGFASATNYKNWGDGTRIGEAGWNYNANGEKVTWFNNGMFMAFKIG